MNTTADEKIIEVTLHLDIANDMVQAWFERLMESTAHPMYQNGIRVAKTAEPSSGSTH